jgi:hypothetical protein
MRLRLVLTGGAQSLPDKGDGVQPEHFDALICKKQHLFGHGTKHFRIGIVQVPLVAVEGGPNPAIDGLAPGKAAFADGWKDIPQVFLVLVSLCAVRKCQVIV